MSYPDQHVQVLRERIARLDAERARLRAALERLVWATNGLDISICDYCGQPEEDEAPGMTSLGPCGACGPLRVVLAPAAPGAAEEGGA